MRARIVLADTSGPSREGIQNAARHFARWCYQEDHDRFDLVRAHCSILYIRRAGSLERLYDDEGAMVGETVIASGSRAACAAALRLLWAT